MGHRTVVRLCILCGLLVSAVAAQSASAVGTTAYTCVAGSGAGFTDAHCKTPTGSGSFGHKAIANNSTTHVKVTNETTGGVKETMALHAVINGVLTELSSNNIESTDGAWLENKEEGGEMLARGEGQMIFKEVKVTKPADCQVKSSLGVGTIETTQLKATTLGQGDAVQFAPATGIVFAEFAIESNGTGVCPVALPSVKVVGSVKGTPEGATIRFDSAQTTFAGTLRIGSTVGPKAGLAGSVTTKAAGAGEETKPIAGTT